MDQQQQQSPSSKYQTDIMNVEAPPLPAPVSAPLVKPVCPSELGPIEEFVIGCLSGVIGAAFSWLQLSGFEVVIYVILFPAMMLEVWESYVLFNKATMMHNNLAGYNAAVLKAVRRKRLARQLFGQGFIMGNAGLEVTQPGFDITSSTLRITMYAVVGLGWIFVCSALNSFPPQDKIATQAKKQHLARRHSRKLQRTSTGTRISRSSTCHHSNRRRSHSTRSSQRRHSHSASVPCDLP